MSTKKKDELIVWGYLRQNAKIDIPTELWGIILTFYHLLFDVLEWNEKYKSKKGYELSDDNKLVKRIYLGVNADRYGDNYYCWIVGGNPVFSGIHCWRLFIENPNKDWMTYAVSVADKRFDEKEFGQHGVIGIAYNDCWYPYGSGIIKKNSKFDYVELQHFNDPDMVDILFDCDKGEVEFAVVGKPDLFRPKLWNIHEWITDNKHGWVPHFNTRSFKRGLTTSLRLAKIDISYYGNDHEELNWKSLSDKV